jgi:glycosyltransferase involved in cell wall biosynthesis
VVLSEGNRLRWGGDIRRHYLLRPLAHLTQARKARSWTADALRGALDEAGLDRPRLASVELLDREALDLATRRTRPTVVDFHDEPVAHAAALGDTLSAERGVELRSLVESNLATFRDVICQSPEFVRFVGLDAQRTFIAPSGTDSRLIVPGPWPVAPVVGMVSGASPGRGIEALVAACRLLRADLPKLRLWLALVGTTESGRAYLLELVESFAAEPWITIEAVPYPEIGQRLAATSVLVIPHPAHPYWDAVLPIKMFDYLAAGRPVVTTPRSATASLLVGCAAGVVADGDGPTHLAAAIGRLLEDDRLSRRMGAAGRKAAETTYDWSVIGRRLAIDIVRREDRVRWLGHRIRVVGKRAVRRAS